MSISKKRKSLKNLSLKTS